MKRIFFTVFVLGLTLPVSGQIKMFINKFDGTSDSLLLSDFKSFTFKTAASTPKDMIEVVGGTFQMGGPNGNADELPVHSVTLHGFYIDKTEITYEKWTEVHDWAIAHGYDNLAAGVNGYNATTSNNPVVSVSWYEVMKWCNARSEKEGLTPVYYTDGTQTVVMRTVVLSDYPVSAVKWTANGYRMPTEAEWEFAARGGTKSMGYVYSGSNVVDDVSWYASNTSGIKTMPVATKLPNELGIYDMSGNVWEWCWDWYGPYSASAQTDPKGPQSGTLIVLRGGALNGYASDCRVTRRFSSVQFPLINNVVYIGVRCVRY